ncbi:MAG: hypothetical protein RL590_275, partial [Actinomycetota bacterium]
IPATIDNATIESTDAATKVPNFPANPVNSIKSQDPATTNKPAKTLGINALGVGRHGFKGTGIVIIFPVSLRG